jgi:hypothetical protein
VKRSPALRGRNRTRNSRTDGAPMRTPARRPRPVASRVTGRCCPHLQPLRLVGASGGGQWPWSSRATRPRSGRLRAPRLRTRIWSGGWAESRVDALGPQPPPPRLKERGSRSEGARASGVRSGIPQEPSSVAGPGETPPDDVRRSLRAAAGSDFRDSPFTATDAPAPC